MKYFAYIVAVYKGCAPNPFHRFCTLVICKPRIRDQAKGGDWIIGLGKKEKVLKNLERKTLIIFQS